MRNNRSRQSIRVGCSHGEHVVRPVLGHDGLTIVFVVKGRVRTKLVKRASRHIIEKYYSKLTLDFDINKKIVDEVAIVPSKRVRNKIAGYTTHLMKRIQRGPVRGISLKLQEEERERRLDYVPEKSAINTSSISVSEEVKEMLESIKFADIPGLKVESPTPAYQGRPQRSQRA